MGRAEGSRTSRLKITSYKDLHYQKYLVHTWPQIYGGEKKDCMYFFYPLRTEQKSMEEFLLSIINNFLATSAV